MFAQLGDVEDLFKGTPQCLSTKLMVVGLAKLVGKQEGPVEVGGFCNGTRWGMTCIRSWLVCVGVSLVLCNCAGTQTYLCHASDAHTRGNAVQHHPRARDRNISPAAMLAVLVLVLDQPVFARITRASGHSDHH